MKKPSRYQRYQEGHVSGERRVGSITVEVEDGYEVQTVLDEAKLRLDAISTFPVNIEKPNIYQIKPENNVIWVSVYGDMTLHDMKSWLSRCVTI